MNHFITCFGSSFTLDPKTLFVKTEATSGNAWLSSDCFFGPFFPSFEKTG